MGTKDATQKTLMRFNDVFADFANVFLFNGKDIVSEAELRDCESESIFHAEDGKVRNQDRDVVKYLTKAGVRLAVLGVENQSVQDRDMPLRIIAYNGASYKLQVVEHKTATQKKRDRLPTYPVITVVLNTGKDAWSAPKSLLEAMEVEIPEEMLPYVSDYRIHVIDVINIPQEQLLQCKSDFAHFAGFIQSLYSGKELIAIDRPLDHPEETVAAMSALAGDTDLLDVFLQIPEEERKGGTFRMCQVTSKFVQIGEQRGIEIGEQRGIEIGEQRGIEIGEQRGIEIGEQKEFYGLVERLSKMGKSLRDMIDFSGRTEEEVLEALAKQSLQIPQ